MTDLTAFSVATDVIKPGTVACVRCDHVCAVNRAVDAEADETAAIVAAELERESCAKVVEPYSFRLAAAIQARGGQK